MTTPTDKEKLRAIIRHLEDTPWPVEMLTDGGMQALKVARISVRHAIRYAIRVLNEKPK